MASPWLMRSKRSVSLGGWLRPRHDTGATTSSGSARTLHSTIVLVVKTLERHVNSLVERGSAVRCRRGAFSQEFAIPRAMKGRGRWSRRVWPYEPRLRIFSGSGRTSRVGHGSLMRLRPQPLFLVQLYRIETVGPHRTWTFSPAMARASKRRPLSGPGAVIALSVV